MIYKGSAAKVVHNISWHTLAEKEFDNLGLLTAWFESLDSCNYCVIFDNHGKWIKTIAKESGEYFE